MNGYKRDALSEVTAIELGDGFNRINLSFVSSTPHDRFDWVEFERVTEILDCSDGAIERDRLDAGLINLLWNHNSNDVRGVLESIAMDGEVGRAVVKMSRSPKGEELYKEVVDGIIKGASLMYEPIEMETILEPEYEGKGNDLRLVKPRQVRTTKYRIYEVSLCSIPADPTVGVGRSESDRLISLRQSRWPQFDREWAERLKKSYPDIWEKSGGIRGNEAFELWGKARSGDRSPEVIDWINEREMWIARHYEDSQLSGTIAQIKWGAIGKMGTQGMKNLVDKEQKMSEKDDSNVDLQQEIASLKAQNAELKSKLETVETRSKISGDFVKLKERSDALNQQGKLPTKELESLFSKKIDDILEMGDPISHLRSLEFYLNQVELRSPALNLNPSQIPQETQPETVVKGRRKVDTSKIENGWKR